MEESIKDDAAVTDDLEEDLQDLKDIMALGAREADDLVQSAKSNAYTYALCLQLLHCCCWQASRMLFPGPWSPCLEQETSSAQLRCISAAVVSSDHQSGDNQGGGQRLAASHASGHQTRLLRRPAREPSLQITVCTCVRC